MKRTAFTLSSKLRDDYKQHVARLRGYGSRRKSRWVCEAIETLFRDDPMLSRVGLSGREAKDAVDLVLLNERCEKLIEEAFPVLRGQHPQWEGVQGDIIRAAVAYRLALEKRVVHSAVSR